MTARIWSQTAGAPPGYPFPQRPHPGKYAPGAAEILGLHRDEMRKYAREWVG